MMVVNFCKFRPDAFTPSKAYQHDAGYDLRVPEDVLISNQFGSTAIDLGVGVFLPCGYTGLMLPRSSTFSRRINVITSVIDAQYTGALAVLASAPCGDVLIKRGESIAQLVIVPCVSAVFIEQPFNSLASARGSKGFGSSGK